MGGEQDTVRVGASTLIIDGSGRLLIGKRAAKPAGMWTFPGGGIEFGETSEQAAVREAKEETGLDVKPTGFIKAHEMIVPENRMHRVIFFYKAVVLGGKLSTNEETSEWRWLTPSEISKLDPLGHTVLPILREAGLL